MLSFNEAAPQGIVHREDETLESLRSKGVMKVRRTANRIRLGLVRDHFPSSAGRLTRRLPVACNASAPPINVCACAA
jgi:hypothetical protein